MVVIKQKEIMPEIQGLEISEAEAELARDLGLNDYIEYNENLDCYKSKEQKNTHLNK